MTKTEDGGEEEQHLATLHELEATQEEIASYQGLLKDLPEIYERKFNERIRSILDRNQQLIEEREQLLHQLSHALPPTQPERKALPSAPPLPPPPEAPLTSTPQRRARGRAWWLGAIACVAVGLGLQWSKRDGHLPSPAPLQGRPAEQSPEPGRPELATENTVRAKVVDQALREWRFFGRPLLEAGRLVRPGQTETDPGQWERVLTYWREGASKDTLMTRADVGSIDNPWSAAFIAYVMKQAGAGDRFPYASSHSGQIKEAIYNRKMGVNGAPLIGHRVTDYAPRAGDLLCATRGWAVGQVDYDNASRFDFFPSRCELVVSPSSAQITTIAGDLMDTVGRNTIAAKDGKIPPQSAQNWLVVIQTRLDD